MTHKAGFALALILMAAGPLWGAAPELLRTPGFQEPARAAPDDLLFIAGAGFQPGDRVVYEAVAARAAGHPESVPNESSTKAGTADVVRVDADHRAIVARFPDAVNADTVYRVWVVTAEDEWSAPICVNDPRPGWISPDYVYASSPRPGLRRQIRIVGRNLSLSSRQPGSIRLQGPAVYELVATTGPDAPTQLHEYVAEADLPATLAIGKYKISIRRPGERWVDLAEQTLEVRPNPKPEARFQLTDQRFGGCQAGTADASDCLLKALAAARAAGGASITIPAGQWNLAAQSAAGFEIPPGVSLRGAGPQRTSIKWLVRTHSDVRSPLLTLTGRNLIEGIAFSDAETFASTDRVRPVIRLGAPGDTAALDDIVIADSRFTRVGMAILESGRPLHHLLVVHNEFGAWQEAIYLAHTAEVEDSVFRWNHFLPGSYLDIGAHQGSIASEIGASHRMDFSDNFADGAATGALQAMADQPGFRAAFFWNLTGNHEQLLIAGNRIECPGDKAGDGEAVSFDDNGNTPGFEAAQAIESAGADWVRVAERLSDQHPERHMQPEQFIGHWVLLVDGRGLGQTRKITAVITDRNGSNTTLRVRPAWDVPPATGSRLVVSEQFWQTYVVGNEVRQDSPTCRKSNLNGPFGGSITLWAPFSDSVIDANRQIGTSGINFNQMYSAQARSCASCRRAIAFQTALEIRNNVIDGEYDWFSDCSKSGITGTFAASPTPESPPPRLSFGVQVDHNDISHADGLRGGAIDIALSWYSGPPPGDWPMVDHLLVFHNFIHDVEGPAPRAACKFNQGGRTALRIEGKGNSAVLYGNRCERARNFPSAQYGKVFAVCGKDPGSCECDSVIRP
jgi:hypothetical protein